MDALWLDLRYTIRQLRKSPGFTAVVIVTLALGIGANSALFGIVNAALLRPLPYPHPDRIVSISIAGKTGDTPLVDEATVRALLGEHPKSFEAISAYQPGSASLTGGVAPEAVDGGRVSAGFFRTLGVRPTLGREFTTDETRADGPPVAIIAHDLWVRDFARDPHVLGRAMTLDDKSYTIVGVMPPGFNFPDGAVYWSPLELPASSETTTFTYYKMIGRTRAGVSATAAAAELSALRRAHKPELLIRAEDENGVGVMPLHDRLYGNLRPALLILLGTVGCVLLIACANVANLLLARALARRRELAVRAALGAARSRLVRQLLVESVSLALLGGACGLLMAFYALKMFIDLAPESITEVPGISIDGHVLLFTLVVSLLTGLLFGIAPAIANSRADLHDALKEGGLRAGAGSGGGRRNPRRLLVTGELALAVVLLVGAGLLAKSFVRFRDIDIGFHPDGVLTATVTLPRGRYPDSMSVATFFRQAVERVRAIPGVQSAAVANATPLGDGYRMFVQMTKNPTTGVAIRRPPIVPVTASPDYFRTFGIALHSGRDFTGADNASSPRIAIINEAAARAYFPGTSPIGRNLAAGPDTQTVVGVVADVLPGNSSTEALASVYVPPSQSGFSPSMIIALRTRVDPLSLTSAVRQAVRAVDPEQPLAKVETMDAALARRMAPKRFNAMLLGAFATLALTLAAFGLYALIAFLVTQRAHEIGIRMALGAERRDVLALVLRQGLTLVVGGVIAGLVATFWLTRLLTTMLFDVKATDPAIFVAVPLLLIAVAVLATLIPARRATRVDPVVALRSE